MSGGELKLIALILMTLDHIGVFFPNSPIWFRYLGRLAAPIFFFTAAEGIYYTHDRIGYLKRLYKASILMSVLEFIYSHFSGIFIENNIFASILHGTIIVYIIEEFRENKVKRNKLMIVYIVHQIITALICICINNYGTFLGYPFTKIVFTVLMNYLFSGEGSFYLTLAIVIFYLCRNNKKKATVVFTVYCLIFFALTVLKVPTNTYRLLRSMGLNRGITDMITLPFDLLGFEMSENIARASYHELAFTKYYQWMMIFSLPLILTYNGKRGEYSKKFFYIYYPLHIFILSTLSIIFCG